MTEYYVWNPTDNISRKIMPGSGISFTEQNDEFTIISAAGGISSTTDLSEGSNLYFTNERAQDAVNTTTASSAPYCTYTKVTGLTLSNTNILKITGEAAGVGAATDDIVAKLSTISWIPAA